jgi:hypothetical protein
VEEARVLVTLLDGMELPSLLPVSCLLADGEGELGPRIIPEGSFLSREVARLLKEINEVNDKSVVIIMQGNKPMLAFPNLGRKLERFDLGRNVARRIPGTGTQVARGEGGG